MLRIQAEFRRDFDHCPDEHCEPGRGDDTGFDEEEPTYALRRDEHERELEKPVENIAHHSCIAYILWELKGVATLTHQQ